MQTWARSSSLSLSSAAFTRVISSGNFAQGVWLVTGIFIFQVTGNIGMYAAALSTSTPTFDEYAYSTKHYETTDNGNAIQVSLPM